MWQAREGPYPKPRERRERSIALRRETWRTLSALHCLSVFILNS